jgi:hypothetical protein
MKTQRESESPQTPTKRYKASEQRNPTKKFSPSGIYVCGNNTRGQLGYKATNEKSPILHPAVLPVPIGRSKTVKFVGCGFHSTVIVTSNLININFLPALASNDLYACGENYYGQVLLIPVNTHKIVRFGAQ